MAKKIQYILIGCLAFFIILFIMSLINKSFSASLTSLLFILIIAFQFIMAKVNFSPKVNKLISIIFIILIILLLVINLFSLLGTIKILKLKAM